MKRTASARWSGDLKTGKGSLTTQSEALKGTPYSFPTRFEDVQGTNPEELIGAAHAGCFTMALSVFLGNAGFVATQLDTVATVNLEQVGGDWTVTEINLKLIAQVPNMTQTQLEEIASEAKAKCPISRLLKAKITLSATLNV
jgi:lipoyl-dependent peroxiredoxin